MTVADMIDALQKLPQDLEVCVFDQQGDWEPAQPPEVDEVDAFVPGTWRKEKKQAVVIR